MFGRRNDNPAPRLCKAKKRKEREAILAKRPLAFGPDPAPSATKRKADDDPDNDLEDIFAFERRKDNPASRLMNTKKKKEAGTRKVSRRYVKKGKKKF